MNKYLLTDEAKRIFGVQDAGDAQRITKTVKFKNAKQTEIFKTRMTSFLNNFKKSYPLSSVKVSGTSVTVSATSHKDKTYGLTAKIEIYRKLAMENGK